MINIIISKIFSISSIGWFGVDNPVVSPLVGETGDGSVIFAKVASFLSTAVVISSVVAIAFIVWGGVTYITANGDADKIKKGTGTIVNAIIGLVIIFLSQLIIRFVMGKILA